jgi:hypothetical protein
MASEMISELSSRGTNRQVAKEILDYSPAKDIKLQAVFGSREAAEEFLKKMTAERELAKQLRSVAGSETARRTAAREIDPLEVVSDVAAVGSGLAPWSGMAGLLRTIRGGASRKVQQSAARELGDILSTQGTPAIEELLRQWQRRPTLLSRPATTLLPVGAGVAAQGLLSQ